MRLLTTVGAGYSLPAGAGRGSRTGAGSLLGSIPAPERGDAWQCSHSKTLRAGRSGAACTGGVGSASGGGLLGAGPAGDAGGTADARTKASYRLR
jgi:hypothetical protein